MSFLLCGTISIKDHLKNSPIVLSKANEYLNRETFVAALHNSHINYLKVIHRHIVLRVWDY